MRTRKEMEKQNGRDSVCEQKQVWKLKAGGVDSMELPIPEQYSDDELSTSIADEKTVEGQEQGK